MPYRGAGWREKIMNLTMPIALAAALIAGASPVAAQSWPAKPIRAFIPFSAGSATDIIPRSVFEPLSAELGQPIVVENRGGAGGTIGVGAVVAAEPDGYTVLANSSAHTVAPFIVPNLPYNVGTDLRAAAALGKNANVLIVSPDKGWRTLDDLVAAARAKPGALNYGSAGVGTATHVSAERLLQSAKIDVVHVPYKGGPEALADVLAGRVDFYYCPISTAIPLIRDGRLRALAVSTPTRAAALPDVPTSIEAGYPDSDYTVWYGVFMPAKTPDPVVERFYEATTKVLQTPALRERLAQLAVDPLPLTPKQLDQRVADELAANAVLIKAARIK
jgi:tripartite-type tricarboxylate transporter receptor subunit TctC